jgi:hypothetical protein
LVLVQAKIMDKILSGRRITKIIVAVEKCIFENRKLKRMSKVQPILSECVLGTCMRRCLQNKCARVDAADVLESGKKRRVWVCCRCRRPQSAHAASADGKLGANGLGDCEMTSRRLAARLSAAFLYIYMQHSAALCMHVQYKLTQSTNTTRPNRRRLCYASPFHLL